MCSFEYNKSNHKEYPSILDIRPASSRIPNLLICVLWVRFRFFIMIPFGRSKTLEMLFLKHISLRLLKTQRARCNQTVAVAVTGVYKQFHQLRLGACMDCTIGAAHGAVLIGMPAMLRSVEPTNPNTQIERYKSHPWIQWKSL